jgi:hypothetical protein
LQKRKKDAAKLKYTKHLTVKEWKKFCKNPVPAGHLGNQIQFFNFFTQRLESYDFITTGEVMLHRYKVILTDHHNRHSNKMIVTPLKEKLKDGLKSLPGKMTMQNFDKGMKVFDESMQGLTKSLDQLGDGLGGKKDSKSKMEKLWGKPKSNNMDFITGKSSKSKSNNLEKVWGSTRKSKRKSSSVKIWSDKPVQKKTKRKSKSDEWDNREAIWGKSKKFKL